MSSSVSFHDRYLEFLDQYKRIAALRQIGGILSWDQETMMPAKGAPARAEQMGALEYVVHGLETSPAYAETVNQLIEQAEGQNAPPDIRRSLDLAKRSLERANKVPAHLAAALAKETAQGQVTWAKARAAKRFEDFAPTLKRIIALKREEADALRQPDQRRYDILLNDFEPGMTGATLRPLLESMRGPLTDLRQKIAQAQISAPELSAPELKGRFKHKQQMNLARQVAKALSYDFEAGRLDLSVHPFSSGTGGDARITTRVDEKDPMGCLYSTIHEIGHALYEQGLPDDAAMQPIGHHVSMGIHESQSRLWENQVGRSRAFCRWLQPCASKAFGDFGVKDADALYQAVNRVKTDYIRTEADEVHYNLHVLLRYELEEDLIEGKLEVDDLETAWNQAFLRDFGLAVPDPSQGVLQDVHWSCGLFGYFPTYSLGNIYSAQLFKRMKQDLPNLDDGLSRGDCKAALGWLRERVHQKGRRRDAPELMQDAVGESVSTQPMLDYLSAKYAELYRL
ncbi:MAG: carboxypeptidase M32 [Pseudomonadota bacterium]